MSLTDTFGYEVSISDAAALDAWTRTTRAFISHAADTPVHLTKASGCKALA